MPELEQYQSKASGRQGLFLTAFFLLSVLLLSLTYIRDTDAWMHLSLGKAIFEHKGIPQYEPYVYTMEGKPFEYGSWLFGLIYYLSYHFFAIYGVILLKAATIVIAFSLLLRDALRPHKNYVIAVLIMTAVVFLSRHRFVERPDTFLMVFLPFSIFALNAFLYENRKYLYALPLIHLLWANTHASLILMVVPFLSFIGGGILQLLINRHYGPRRTGELFPVTPSVSKLIIATAVFIASYGATFITPHTKGALVSPQLLSGSQFMSVDWYKQEIAELQPPTWDSIKEPYILTGMVLLSFVMAWVAALKKKKDRSPGQGAPLMIHLFLVVPFIYLSFSAIRFIFLLAIISGPVISRNISGIAASRSWNRFFSRRAVTVFVAAWIVACTIFLFEKGWPLGSGQMKPGFGIDYALVPEGALQYMDKRGITGRVFNQSHWGSYITWRDFPKRSVFIDPRWSPAPEVREKMLFVTKFGRTGASVLNELEGRYGFESILIEYPLSLEKAEGLDVSFSHPEWALVYWDDNSLLYLKRGGRYHEIIRQDEYRFIKPGSDIDRDRERDARYREGVLEDLRRNVRETGSSRGYAFLGSVYNSLGFYQEAIDSFSMVRDVLHTRALPRKYRGIAFAYGKLGRIDECLTYYEKSLALYEDPGVLYNVGLIHMSRNEKKQAIKYFTRALAVDQKLTSVYPVLMGLYRELGMKDELERAEKMYEKARMIRESEEHNIKGLQAYLEKDYSLALQEFNRSIEANPSDPAPYFNIGNIYFIMGTLDRAYRYQEKALELDPGYAAAHYGLGLIYKEWGDMKTAKKHWQEYLRMEPSGYFSRRAKEELRATKN